MKYAFIIFLFYSTVSFAGPTTDDPKEIFLWAAQVGDKEAIDRATQVLSSGIGVNDSLTERGHTAAHVAAIWDSGEFLRFLKERGADLTLSLPGEPKATPYWSARIHKSVKAMDVLRNDESLKAKSDLIDFAENGDIKGADVVLEKGLFGVDEPLDSYTGVTAVGQAANQNQAEFIQHLCKHYSAHVDKSDSNGLSPLYDATKRGALGAMQALLENDADPNKKFRGMGTPLHFAFSKKNEDSIALLLAHGARLDLETNSNGDDPVQSCLKNNRHFLDQILIKYFAQRNGDESKYFS